MRKPPHGGQPCPNPACAQYWLMDRGNISAISTSLTQSGNRRLCRCSACEQPFSETRATVCCGLRSPAEKVMMALKRLRGPGALSAMGFVLGVTEATGLEWLRRAAQQVHESNRHRLRARPVTQGPLDEMGPGIRRQPARPARAPRGAQPGGRGSGSVSPRSVGSAWPRLWGHGRGPVSGSASRGRQLASGASRACAVMAAVVTSRRWSLSTIPGRPCHARASRDAPSNRSRSLTRSWSTARGSSTSSRASSRSASPGDAAGPRAGRNAGARSARVGWNVSPRPCGMRGLLWSARVGAAVRIASRCSGAWSSCRPSTTSHGRPGGGVCLGPSRHHLPRD